MRAPFLATALARLIRPHQWLKNGFVLVGVLFAHKWSDATLLAQMAATFGAFCAVASAVYVGNDLVDVEADRRHPVKSRRPIASGTVSQRQALLLCAGLLGLGLGLAAWVSWRALAFTGAYVLLNVAYSLHFKHQVIIDVFCISAGFMLRILVGTLGLGIQPSSWLLLCGLMFTLFLGFAKRRAELLHVAHQGGQTRRVLQAYRPVVLEQFLSVSATCTVLSYALYTVSPETVALHGTANLIYTVPLIVYGIFRYLVLLHGKDGGQDTARDLLTDRHLLVCMLSWLALTGLILA